MTKQVKRGKATVFLVPGDETSSGKHEVAWANDGDLNKAHKEGHVERFSDWDKAVGFAHARGQEIKGEVIIHYYGEKPTMIYRYPKISQRINRITPRFPKLR